MIIPPTIGEAMRRMTSDPVPEPNMMGSRPAMNMTFTVKDKALLGKFSQDKKVEFEFEQQGSDYVITSAK